MKTQKVWILPNNNTAGGAITWVDPANPVYTNNLKGQFIEVEAKILNGGVKTVFKDDEYQDTDCGYNTKTIIIEKTMPILGCKSVTSVDRSGGDIKIIKKKRPLSYLFLKKPTFEGEDGGSLNNPSITFKIKQTQGSLGDGGSYSQYAWKTITASGKKIYGNFFNRLAVFFLTPEGKVITNTDGKPVAFYILLTKNYDGDIAASDPTFMNAFSGSVSDDEATPHYLCVSTTYGTGTYKYTWRANLNNNKVSYVYDNTQDIATLVTQITHDFPQGTRLCVGLGCGSSYSSSSSSSYATPENVEKDLPFTAKYLSGGLKIGTSKEYEFDSDFEQNGADWVLKQENHLLLDITDWSSATTIEFTNPNADSSLSASNPYPINATLDAVGFPLCGYDTYAKQESLPALNTFFSHTVPPEAGPGMTYNTPCWTFLQDIQRTMYAGNPVMKGTIRYLSYMAGLQPEGNDYRDFEPYEIGE